ncbi:MAG: hypothetical protein R3F56_14975 [Planctomycetota bacterium]
MRAVLTLALVLPVAGQWSNNPVQNLAVGDRAGEQAVAKIATAADGGCYVAWFDNQSGNYDVYLQRLDAGGVEQWPHNGVLVSGNPQNSSLVDWDLMVDSTGAAVLAFTDVRSGPDLDVYAYRVDRSGAMQWGANGVALSNNTEDEANPRLCETSDHDIVCVWPNTSTRSLRVQRLDLAGTPRYAANGLVIPGDATDTPAFARVVAGDQGSFIVSWVRALAFAGNKHIHTQKFDVAGNPLWGSQRFVLFDLASVPIAHEPRLLADGQGGAIYAWHYAVGSVFSVRVQRMLAGGTETFPHNGLDVSTNGNSKFDPALVWHGDARDICVFWNERNTAQSQWGISGQRLDVAGQRLWGPNGAVLLPVDGVNKLSPVATRFGVEDMVCVLEASLGANQHRVRAMRVRTDGSLAGSVVDASVAASEKLRLQAAANPSGTAMLCWTDRRSDAGDVYAQNVNPDLSLGAELGVALIYGCINPPQSFAVDGRPALGTTITFRVDNPLNTQAPGSLSAFVFATRAQPGFPCGIGIPGFGMQGNGAWGELLVDIGTSSLTFPGSTWPGASFSLPIPVDLLLAGARVYVQGFLIDPSFGAIAPLGFANAARLDVRF